MIPKHILIACLLGGLFQTMASDVLIVVEDAIHDRLTQLPALQLAMTADGWDVETVRYDSRVYRTNTTGGVTTRTPTGQINVSSRAARNLATSVIWPRVNAGVRHVFMIGELPCAVSGLNCCPDGHGITFNWDGWRDAANTAGAYRAPHFYGCPGPFGGPSSGWSDSSTALLSECTQRMNAPGDGRFDQDLMPAKLKAAVGWLGGFGDLALDVNGLNRRAKIINDYLRRNVAYRTGNWQTAGAAYEFPIVGPDGHADRPWWDAAFGLYGPLAVANAKVLLIGTSLTNRPVAFRQLFTGSDWVAAAITKLKAPLTPVVFLNFSFNKEVPAFTQNMLARCLIDSPNYGPLVVIPFHMQSRNDIRLLEQRYSVGEMILEASQRLASTVVFVSIYGDPTLRLD